MKLNINFLQTGGVPLTNDLMADIMSAIQIYDVLGALAGHCTIISGCEVTGNSVAPGVVAINGEVLEFAGGILDYYVFVEEQQIYKTFQDQNDKILITKKVVKFGLSVAPNLYPWSDFVRLDTLKAMKEKLDNTVSQQDFDAMVERVEILEQQTAPIINGGVVFPWRKPVGEIPAGWKECTDFRGKMLFGRHPNIAEFSQVGMEGGNNSIVQTVAQMPKHKHGYTPSRPWQAGSGGGFRGGDNTFSANSEYTSEVGGNEAMDIMNPYRIVNFIEPDFQ